MSGWLSGLVTAVLVIWVGLQAISIPNPLTPYDFTGKTFVLTGCSPEGLGYAVAHRLVSWNATVICGLRDKAKALKVLNDITASVESAPVKSTGKIIVEPLDLLDFQSVRGFARDVLSNYPKLDGVILNAGLAVSWHHGKDKNHTADGEYHEVFKVNHLSQFLLLRLLEERVLQSERPRVVIVSSQAHMLAGAKLPMDLYFDAKQAGWRNDSLVHLSKTMRTYADSKLMNILTAKALAKKHAKKHPNLQAYSVCPGYVNTAIYKPASQFTSVPDLLHAFSDLVARDLDGGAARILALVGAGDVLPHQSGDFVLSTFHLPASPADNEADAAELWRRSSEIFKLDASF